MGGIQRTSKIALVVGMLVLGMLLAVPSSPGNSDQNSASVLANGSRQFTIGILDYAGSVATLNPFILGAEAEYETVMPIYSTLLTYDVNGNIIGDLATSWSVSPDGKTWTFNLARNAYFVDPSNPLQRMHQVTATDVIWTYDEVNTDANNFLNYYFTHDGAEVIDSLTAGVDQFQVIIHTSTPYAPFVTAAANIPIVPEYIWGHVSNPVTFANLPPVGSGPFYYGLPTLPLSYGLLYRNPIWFQEENRGWQIHIDRLMLKNELSATTAWAELTTSPPVIDVYQGLPASQYVAQVLGGGYPYIAGFAQSTGTVYEYQLNQLTNSLRASLGLTMGSNNQLLQDPTVKLAMAMCVDKQAFIDRTLSGLGTVADSIVPDINSWHYTYPNPIAFDPAQARQNLMDAGWQWDSMGNPATPSTVPLCKKGLVNNTIYHPLVFRLTTPFGMEYDIGSASLAGWAALAGIQLNRILVSYNQMNAIWYSGDYDAWLWDWEFTPMSDPSVDCLSIDTTMEIGRWSGSFWSNPTYDTLYNQSLYAVDPSTRRQYTDQMQAMAYEDHNHQLIAYAKSLNAVNYQLWDQASFGNWEANWALMPEFYLPWLYMQLSPVDNPVPTVSTTAQYQGVAGSPMIFVGNGIDLSSLVYQWYWGDGSSSGWTTGSTSVHIYASPGVYTAYFAAKEANTADQFSSWTKTTVTITGSNTAPHSLSITMQPSRAYLGAVITFTGSAVDDEGDPLYYSWDFGDGTIATGQVAQHAYLAAGTYMLKMSVTDNVPGPGRPAYVIIFLPVGTNSPPTASVPSVVVTWKTTATFTIVATDPDGDSLRITWLWGDKTVSVTNGPTTTHYYKQKGTYTLTVFVDDLTGLSGHNVTASGTVTVKSPRK